MVEMMVQEVKDNKVYFKCRKCSKEVITNSEELKKQSSK